MMYLIQLKDLGVAAAKQANGELKATKVRAVSAQQVVVYTCAYRQLAVSSTSCSPTAYALR